MRHPVAAVRSVTLLLFATFLSFSIHAQTTQQELSLSAADADSGSNTDSITTVANGIRPHPHEDRLQRGKTFNGDVRTLPQTRPHKFERPEVEDPDPHPVFFPGTKDTTSFSSNAASSTNSITPTLSAPAPAPVLSFDGLDFATWGAGHPPDTNGDVGPQYYIQTINTSVGIYNKSDGSQAAAFTFNTLMSQGNFGNLCDTNNFGDPVVLYDTFEDRWIITDFAFALDGSGNVIAPTFQCLAVSKSGDPVAGGWNFYYIQINNALGDYPKFGIWTDGLYMSANVFTAGAGSTFENPRVWAFNKAQMYAGVPTVQVVSFDAPAADFTVLPSNARLQTGTPPAGTPNYFVSTWQFLNALTVYKFHVDWKSISLSTFTGPDAPLASTSWPNSAPPNAPSLGGNLLDVLEVRAMVQNRYTNIGGQESLWTAHTVRRQNTSGFAAPRWYQVNVTGGTVAASLPQAATWDPDGANVSYRFMPSVAVDRVGDMAMGYSKSSSTTKPSINYAGRLAADPVNTFSQTEQLLIQGAGTQTGSCGGTCIRWGDYSAMTLDTDGCTFWYTNLYYQVDGLNFNTRVANFSFPGCTSVASGTLQGTVTDSVTTNPISGVNIALGSRTTTTDVNGNYTFAALPSGTYPTLTASAAGYQPSSASNIVITDATTTTQNFSLTLAPTSGCLTDTTQADFQAGVATNCDLTTSPGDVTLLNAPNINQQSTTLGTSGVGITTTTWGGQTFTPSITGQLTRIDINLFCSGCTGTTPNLTLSLRATSGGLPTGADLAAATVTGFSSGAAVFYTATFGAPPTLTAGTMYAIVIRPTSNPSPGTYALTRSGTSTAGSNVYAGGTRVSGATSGTVWSIPLTGGVSTDAGFKVYIQNGFASPGTFTSSLKDANPAPGATANWSTLSWTADTPANTNIQFQVAGSNSPTGPFSFVGPDGTASTFFSNGGSLTLFAGDRYLEYQAALTTTDNTVTPTLHDVTVCFNDSAPTTLAVAAVSGTYGGTANLSAILTANSVAVSGESISFTLNGNSAGSATTDGTGTATVSAASLSGINAGTYPGGVAASFAGDTSYSLSSGSNTLTIAKANQTITFGPLANATFGDPDFNVSATSDSGLTVTFGATGNCTLIGANTVHITGTGSCTITASQAGDSNYNAATDVPQTFSISGATPPTISKAFGASQIAVTWSTTLTFTIQNPNATAALTGIGFSDALPTGLVLATPANLSGSCGGGTISAVDGSSSISLSGATLTAGSSCTFSVQVTGTGAGTKNNTTGAITANESGAGGTASATIDVLAPPTVAIAFNPTTIPVNGTTTLTFTIANPSANGAAESPVTLNDLLPSGLTVSSSLHSDPCGLGSGVLHTTAPTTIQAGGLTIPVNTQCVFTVTVTGTVAGQYTNTTGTISSGNGGSGGTASANLTVANPPTISKAFGASQIAMNGTTSLTFTITNPNSGAGLTGVAFTDSLPSGLVISTPNGVSGSCGTGTITATAGAGSISLSAGILAASGSCTFSVNVTGTAAGTKNNTTGAVTATESGAGSTASASIDVITPPSLTAVFAPATIPLNGTTSLTFTITNPAANAVALTTTGFTDLLPTGLTVANSTVANPCALGNGTLTTTAPTSISIGGLTIPASGQCQFSVNVTGASPGQYTNTTGQPSSGNGGTGSAATASITVVGPPTIGKAFGASQIALNGTTSLTFTLNNSNSTTALSGVAFTDSLPAGLIVATPNGLTGTCAGTITAVAGASSVTLSGGSLAASGSCTFSVNVTGTTLGAKNNTTGAITSTEGGTGVVSNTASLTVVPPTPTLAITKTHSGNFAVGGTGDYTITVSNVGAGATDGSTVTGTDTLPSGTPALTATAMSGTGWTCTLGTLTCTRNDVLAAGSSYPAITLTVSVPTGIASSVTNTATVTGGGDAATHTATDPTSIGSQTMSITLAQTGITVYDGQSGSVTFDLETGGASGPITLSCSGLPLGASCGFSPSTITQSSTTVTLTISTQGRVRQFSGNRGSKATIIYAAIAIPGFGLAIVLLTGRKRSKKTTVRLLGIFTSLMLVMYLASCGSSTPYGTPAGSYPIAVTASSANGNASATVTLNVLRYLKGSELGN